MSTQALQPLTLDEFQLALPEKMKKSVNQSLVDRVNAVLSEPELFETYRNNLVSYTKVIQDGKWTAAEYVAAVMYVSHKVMGCSNIDAYSKTFPEKITRFTQQGVAAKDIASYVTAYNKSKLVNLIYEQTLVPVHILNMDLFQRALNVQAELMISAKSEKVRSDAAHSLITQLKPPETKKIELDLGVKENESLKELKAATLALAAQQRDLIRAGVIGAQDAAQQKLTLDVEATEVK